MTRKNAVLLVVGFALVLTICRASLSFAQLQVVVHIWGEVRNPGEFFVPAGTNVLELVSKAGGPTEYGNMSKVKLTRSLNETDRAITIDLNDYLGKQHAEPLPMLQTGDVVRVPRNSWSRWRTLINVVADMAIIANVYYYWFQRE